MSGGSHEYTYLQVEEFYDKGMYDEEMNLFIPDLVKVLHDLEWWKSCDIDEEDYRKTLKEFKDKWFRNNDNKQLAIETIKARAISEIKQL
jgi:hypothetical protein